MEEIILRLNEIKKQINNQTHTKIIFYIQSLQNLVNNPKNIDLDKLLTLKMNIELERKTLKNVLKNNFPLFIKYDNIYREMITLIKFLLIYHKKGDKI